MAFWPFKCPLHAIFLLASSLSAWGGSESSSHLRHRQHGSHSEGSLKNGNLKAAVNHSENISSDIYVNPREEVFLSCYIPLNNLDRIGFGVSWLHDGLVVDTSGRNGHRHRSNPETGQLHISGIRLEDDGLWQCQFQDDSMSHPTLSKPLKLVVLDKPKAPYLLVDNRRLDPGNLFIPVKEGLDLRLSCVVEGGNPSATVKWALILSEGLNPTVLADERSSLALNINEPYGTEDPSGNRVPQSVVTSEASLLSVQRAHHNATIMCIAMHPTLKESLNASILLDVQYSPSFAISREPGFGFPLREGIAVSLKCDVDSNPPSSPLWQKDDKSPPVPQSSDGFLNFTAIRREHSGWYKCTATHLGVDYSSIGYFLNVRSELPPNLTQEMPESYPTGRQVSVPLGGAVQLQCPEEAAGCWSRVGPAGRLIPVGTGPGLLLNNVIYQDAGEYRCATAKRPDFERWRSEVNVDVTVIGRPLVYPLDKDKQLTARLGQRLAMTVEFCANPPAEKAFWVTEARRIPLGQTVDDFTASNLTAGESLHCQQASLTIYRVTMAHAGEYMFFVRSPKGLAEGTFQVNVTQAFAYSNAKTAQMTVSMLILIIMMLLVHMCPCC